MQQLSLDLATRFGWAFGDTSKGDPISGYEQLPSTGEDIGTYIMAYDVWLRKALRERKPDRVVMEAPMPSTQGKTSLSTMLKLHGLCTHTELICAYQNIDCCQIPAATWKAGFCGNGRASKSMKPYPVLAHCHRLGWTKVVDDNEADAIGIWVFSVRFASPGREARFDPLMRGAHQPAA